MKYYIINFHDYVDAKEKANNISVSFALFAYDDTVTLEKASHDVRWIKLM